ncbi:hypothetical protein OAO01_01275 [Oligoflexia bacterium]|nr:hypothetical protein [Oligoflexia bacterium]
MSVSSMWQVSDNVYRVEVAPNEYRTFFTKKDQNILAEVYVDGDSKLDQQILRMDFFGYNVSFLFPFNLEETLVTSNRVNLKVEMFVETNGGSSRRTIPLGVPYKLSSDVEFTKHGFVRIGEHYVSWFGMMMIFSDSSLGNIASKRLNVIYTGLGNEPLSEAESFSSAIKNINQDLDRLSLASYPIPIIDELVTNIPPPSVGINGPSSKQPGSGEFECEEVPDCCCNPEVGGERDANGKCVGIVTALINGGGDLFPTDYAGSALRVLSDNPCTKNVDAIPYSCWYTEGPNGNIALQKANKMRNACGVNRMRVGALCSGGRVAANMAIHANNMDFFFFNTPFRGTRGLVCILGTAVSLFIPTSFAQTNLGVGTNFRDARLGYGNTSTIYYDPNDTYATEISQKSAFLGQSKYKKHDKGHLFAMEKNIDDLAASCCGDNVRQVNRGEDCDPQGSTCTWAGVYGQGEEITCNSECKCKPEVEPECGNGVVEGREMCEKPGSFTCGVTFRMSNGTCKQVKCNDKCMCNYQGEKCTPPNNSSTAPLQ